MSDLDNPSLGKKWKDRAAEVFSDFAATVHGRVPDLHAIDLHTDVPRERGYCGEHGRVVPTWQDLCPVCAGRLVTADEVQRISAAARWGQAAGLYDPVGVDRLRMEKYKPVKLRRKRAA